MKKVAIYSKEIPTTTFIENLITLLSENGYEIYLFGQLKKQPDYKGKVYIIPTPTSFLALIPFVFLQWLKLLIKKPAKAIKTLKIGLKKGSIKNKLKYMGNVLPIINNPVDFFHIQWANDLQMMPELFDLIDAPIDLSLRGAHINYAPLIRSGLADIYKLTFPKIRKFHAVSKAIADEAAKYGANLEKTQVIYSSIKDEIIQKFIVKKSINKLEPTIISVGRFHWKKGYQYALQALKALHSRGIKAKYTIVAQGNLPEEIVYMIHELKLEEYIQIINGLPQNEVIEKIQNHDLFLLPSVEEGIANVVLEAMAIGTPVISTNCGGMEEVVMDGENGFIVPVRDAEAIADVVTKSTKLSDQEIENISIKAHQTIEKIHTRKNMLEGFNKFYTS